MLINMISSSFNIENEKFSIPQDIKKLPVNNSIKNTSEKELGNEKNDAVSRNKFIREQSDIDAQRNAKIIKDDENEKIADAARELLVRKAADELRMLDTNKFLNQELLKQEALKIANDKNNISFDIKDILELSDQRDIASQITDSILFP